MEIRILKTAEEKAILSQAEKDKIRFLGVESMNDRTFIAAIEDGKIAGVASILEQSFRIKNAIGMAFVSVHESYKNRGIAKKIVDTVFSYAQSQNKHVANTRYEPEGLSWLKHVFERTALAYPQVKLYER